MYYNAKLNFLGLLVKRNYIRIYIHEGMRTFMVKTNEWKEVGVL